MESEIQSLKSQLSQYQPADNSQDASPKLADNGKSFFGLGSNSDSTFHIGAYGELKYGRNESSAGWRSGFDAGRVVLLPTWQIAENIIFNAEIEFEHGGIANDEDDKLHGSAEIEQAYLDFKFNEAINWRAPGVDVVPFGYTNLHHEPTQFYSVNRPELYQGLIPSTWFEGSTSLYGNIIDNLTYQFQISTSLEDSGVTGDLPAGGYDAGISGTKALGLARSPIGDFSQTTNDLGYALRLGYTPPCIPGLSGSSSVYFTPNTTPRGAHSDTGASLGHSSLTMVDTELRYRIPKTGWEFRGEYVEIFLGSPGNLRANNDSDPSNNVGDTMHGWSLETAYHFNLSPKLKNGWEIVPFYRYSNIELQSGGYRGSDANMPTGQGERQYHTFGLAVFPTPDVVLKLDYQIALDEAPDSPQADHFLGSVGFAF
ncbi:MAG: hypothetical protein PHD76_14785 [Methylacidiphilales bacterium]|nr:hypothetical protein [Candidatus Methylacidiphilales bacterium]